MFTGVAPSLVSAGPTTLSLKEERIAIAMGDDCKLRDEGPPPPGRESYPVNMYDNVKLLYIAILTPDCDIICVQARQMGARFCVV